MRYQLVEKSRDRKKPRGFSLLELLTAAVLVSGTVVPALAVIRDSMTQSRALHKRKTLSNFAVLKLEEQAALSMRQWTNTTDEDNFDSYGYPEVGFNVIRSDSPIYGGIAGQLMHVQVTVFDDVDGDLLPDAGEMQVLYRTKVAKLSSYENEEL